MENYDDEKKLWILGAILMFGYIYGWIKLYLSIL
tara:strand:- start:10264 stop:10365 length:102 start_codon:yes stop_codon:yes gene_type:complete